MNRKMSSARKWLLMGIPFLSVLLALFFADHLLVNAPTVQLAYFNDQQPSTVTVQDNRLLKGKTPSLSWIVGRDCQRGIQAYLQTSANDPDAALVGTGWLDPTTGKLINGQSNNCMPGSLSMDNVVQLVHSKGGMAYLTITMETDGTAQSWTPQQQAAYIDKATTDQAYIDTIVHEVIRANYDGVIMDLEGTDRTYPNIQQLFATYNQRVHAALQSIHKPYGIALIHKLSDHDDYYDLNAFENWRLLAHAADFIVIMAVDQSYFTPGPAVSIPWLNQLLAYTIQTMPGMLPHIIWELPLYGNSWHWENGQWAFDGSIVYQDAQAIANRVSPAQIDAASSNLQDQYAPHLVYTDNSGVKQSLWFPNAQCLHNIIVGFMHSLQKQPQFAGSQLQIAVWWRTTSEPPGFWHLLDTLY